MDDSPRMFPETSVTLLGQLSAQVTGESEASWLRFWNMYAGAIRHFAVRMGNENGADDIVQLVMCRLVACFKAHQYNAEKGHFRSYLAQMIRNEVGMAWRKEKARRYDKRVSLDVAASAGGDDVDAAQLRNAEAEMAVGDDAVWSGIDEAWAAAKRDELVAAYFANPAVKPLYKDVFRLYVVEGREIGDVAAALNISRNLVSQIKTRVERFIAEKAALIGM